MPRDDAGDRGDDEVDDVDVEMTTSGEDMDDNLLPRWFMMELPMVKSMDPVGTVEMKDPTSLAQAE